MFASMATLLNFSDQVIEPTTMSERRIPYACRSVMLYLYIIGQQLMSLVVLLLYPAQRSWGGGYGVALDVRASSYHTHTSLRGCTCAFWGVRTFDLLFYLHHSYLHHSK